MGTGLVSREKGLVLRAQEPRLPSGNTHGNNHLECNDSSDRECDDNSIDYIDNAFHCNYIDNAFHYDASEYFICRAAHVHKFRECDDHSDDHSDDDDGLAVQLHGWVQALGAWVVRTQERMVLHSHRERLQIYNNAMPSGLPGRVCKLGEGLVRREKNMVL